jgi:hypothetical protein
MKGEKYIQHNMGWDDGFVENDSGNLSVAGSFATDCLVAWVINVAPAIANLNIAYATKLHKARI